MNSKLDTISIDIAPIDDPEDTKRLCIPRAINLKALMDLSSQTLQFEVYGLYHNNKKLTDIESLDDNDVVFGAACISPYELASHPKNDPRNWLFEDSEDNADSPNSLRIGVLGDDGAGKTSFIMRYLHNFFVEAHSHTCLAAEYFTTVQSNGADFDVSVLDTNEEFIERFDKSWIVDQHAFIIAISVEQLADWKPLLVKYLALLQNRSSHLVSVVVTKIDLLSSYDREKKREARVYLKKLKSFARHHNIVLFRNSAKENKRIGAPFMFALKRVHSLAGPLSPLQSSNSIESVDEFYKKPQLFGFLERAAGILKRSICGM